MKRHRTTARGTFLVLLTLLLGAGSAAAYPAAEVSAAKVPPLVFPVVGKTSFIDDFGDPRVQGSHQGNDIMAPQWAPVVAAEAGTVKLWTTSARAGCMLYLYGESGTVYLYIHLNNDRASGNDNSGGCVAGVAYAPGLKSGARVAAGQLLGFNGNSGDADSRAPHTQFEVHPGGGAAVSPYPYLRKARRLLFAAKPGSTFTLALTGKVAAAGTGGVELSVDQVRQWPGGRRVAHAGQRVTVAVPEEAALDATSVARTGDLPFSSVASLTQGQAVTVYTQPAKVTLNAQSGAKGALAAARIVVRR